MSAPPLEGYAIALAALWPALATRDGARSALADAHTDLAEAVARYDEVVEDHQEALERAAAALERYETLEATVGVAVQELHRRLGEVAQDFAARDRAETATRKAEGDARSRHGHAEGRRDTLFETLATIETDRQAAIESLRTFARSGLLGLACPDLDVPDPTAEWAATPAVALARAIDRSLSDVDDGDRRWELDQQAVNAGHKALADGLSRHGHRATMTVRDDAMLVEVTFQGRSQQVAELSAALDDEIVERERVLSARHREILENHLVSEVAALPAGADLRGGACRSPT